MDFWFSAIGRIGASGSLNRFIGRLHAYCVSRAVPNPARILHASACRGLGSIARVGYSPVRSWAPDTAANPAKVRLGLFAAVGRAFPRGLHHLRYQLATRQFRRFSLWCRWYVLRRRVVFVITRLFSASLAESKHSRHSKRKNAQSKPKFRNSLNAYSDRTDFRQSQHPANPQANE